jgi:hypothetical protein
MQPVPITTNVVSSNPAHGEVYSIQNYVIKFVSDLQQVSGFLLFPPPMKLTTTIKMKSWFKHHKPNRTLTLFLITIFLSFLFVLFSNLWAKWE